MKICKPYVDILNELGYKIIAGDLYSTFDPLDYDPDDEDVCVSYHPVFAKGVSRVVLDLIADGYKSVKKYYENEDYTELFLHSIRAYYVYGDEESVDPDDYSCLYFYQQPSVSISDLFDIDRITPDLFRVILKSKENQESELEYTHKIVQRYLDVYNNIIKNIVNPIIKLKQIEYKSSIIDGLDAKGISGNRNIEIDYYNDRGILFTIGVDYITGFTYFYEDIGEVMFDFENKITTKGRFKELLEKYGF